MTVPWCIHLGARLRAEGAPLAYAAAQLRQLGQLPVSSGPGVPSHRLRLLLLLLFLVQLPHDCLVQAGSERNRAEMLQPAGCYATPYLQERKSMRSLAAAVMTSCTQPWYQNVYRMCKTAR